MMACPVNELKACSFNSYVLCGGEESDLQQEQGLVAANGVSSQYAGALCWPKAIMAEAFYPNKST